MPIYEYQCKACGHQLEEIQGVNDKPLLKCPQCGKSKLERLVSAPSFQLKGTGWYVTDFKNAGKKPEVKEKADKTDKTEKVEKTEKKTENKES